MSEWYAALQIGVGLIGGVSTAGDFNPHGLAYDIESQALAGRAALGYRWDRLSLEAGIGRLGRYDRRLEFSNLSPELQGDTVGDVRSYDALDLRFGLHSKPFGRAHAYAFGTLAAVRESRSLWTAPVTDGWMCGACGKWVDSTETSISAGGGIGIDYALTKRLSVTVEGAALFWSEQSVTATAGLVYRF